MYSADKARAPGPVPMVAAPKIEVKIEVKIREKPTGKPLVKMMWRWLRTVRRTSNQRKEPNPRIAPSHPAQVRRR